MAANTLPDAYTAWIESLLEAPVPEEQSATCHDCAMRPPKCGPVKPFSEKTRCCTYTPRLPNFLVGRILDDHGPGSDEARRSVLLRVEAGVGISPLGLVVAPALVRAYQRATAGDGFGRDETLACPHLNQETGGCRIWRHRNAVCATWFCRYDLGARGQRFWQALSALLTVAEHVVAFHVARTLRFPDETAPEEELDERLARLDWGPYIDEPIDFYRQCAALAEPLTLADVRLLAQGKLESHVEQVRRAYSDLLRDPALYARPKLRRCRTVDEDRTRWFFSYSDTDPLALPVELAAFLPFFDGRPLSEIEAKLQTLDVELDPALVRLLLDFRVLEEKD